MRKVYSCDIFRKNPSHVLQVLTRAIPFCSVATAFCIATRRIESVRSACSPIVNKQQQENVHYFKTILYKSVKLKKKLFNSDILIVQFGFGCLS